MATNNTPPDALLLQAIDTVDAKILRSVLKSMCKNSEECAKQASDRLLLQSKPSTSRKHKPDDAAEQSSSTKKQRTEEAPRSRYEMCITCNKSFDVTKNSDTSCRTHDDILTIDYDYFPDDDEVMYGHIDVETDWRRKECPEGFIWQCCEEPLNGTPCVIQKHISKPEPKAAPARVVVDLT